MERIELAERLGADVENWGLGGGRGRGGGGTTAAESRWG